MREVAESSNQVHGFMAFHAAEAIRLADEGFDDILLGYPVVDFSLLSAIAERVRDGRTMCLMADLPEHLSLAEEAGRRVGTEMPVCLDIDMSSDYPGLHFGVWRSSIRTSEILAERLQEISRLKHVRLDGLMGYEAQIAGLADTQPGKPLTSFAVRMLKKTSLGKLRKRRAEAVAAVAAAGHQLRFFNGGGTGSVETTIEEAGITEVTVGSGFYGSHLFDLYRSFDVEPALSYAVPVLRRPSRGIYTLHGGGFNASGAIDELRAPRVYLPNGGELDAREGAGEVQTPVRFRPDPDLSPGDPVFLRHAKAGELLERFNEVLVVSETEATAYPTYRGLGWSFG
jgi:D-serine deaminase-like pyridoxal phosphate-dependent protein